MDNQCRRVLAYMKKFGSITRRQAEDDLGIMNLPARIYELRDTVMIDTIKVKGKNRFGEPTQYGKYVIKEEQPTLSDTDCSSR